MDLSNPQTSFSPMDYSLLNSADMDVFNGYGGNNEVYQITNNTQNMPSDIYSTSHTNQSPPYKEPPIKRRYQKKLYKQVLQSTVTNYSNSTPSSIDRTLNNSSMVDSRNRFSQALSGMNMANGTGAVRRVRTNLPAIRNLLSSEKNLQVSSLKTILSTGPTSPENIGGSLYGDPDVSLNSTQAPVLRPDRNSENINGYNKASLNIGTEGEIRNENHLNEDDDYPPMHPKVVVGLGKKGRKRKVPAEEENVEVDLPMMTSEFAKPVWSFPCLIGLALKNSPSGTLPVSEIYAFILANFPFFRTAASHFWKNAVRHNLSLGKYFDKIEPPLDENGRPSKMPNSYGIVSRWAERLDSEIEKWRERSPSKHGLADPEDILLIVDGRKGLPSAEDQKVLRLQSRKHEKQIRSKTAPDYSNVPVKSMFPVRQYRPAVKKDYEFEMNNFAEDISPFAPDFDTWRFDYESPCVFEEYEMDQEKLLPNNIKQSNDYNCEKKEIYDFTIGGCSMTTDIYSSHAENTSISSCPISMMSSAIPFELPTSEGLFFGSSPVKQINTFTMFAAHSSDLYRENDFARFYEKL